jgi:glyoxylase-like metal-dependent hydrolase (beta-lactamase superfamily II)
MEVTKIAEGLWRWTAPHPEWTPEADWPRDVACFYYEGWEGIALVDPLVPADDEERFWKALDLDVERYGMPVAVVLTSAYHERSAWIMHERYRAAVWAPTAAVERLSFPIAHAFEPWHPLPGGLEALAGDGVQEVLLWIPEHRALVAGDILLGTGDGVRVCPDSWLPDGVTPAALRANLVRALALPTERILVGHGLPVLSGGRAALERALAAAA